MNAPTASRDAPRWPPSWIARVDRYFLSDAIRNLRATELSNVRMGLVLALIAGLGAAVLLPMLFTMWPRPAALISTAMTLIVLGMPFVLRQKDAIRHVGQLVCGVMATACAQSIWFSAGQGAGVLPFLPMLPVIGLLVAGRRGAIRWGAVALVLAALGMGLVYGDTPTITGYAGPSTIERYVIAVLCIVSIGSITQLFETFWNGTAMEVAERAQAELREREEQNRVLLQNASEGVMVVDESAVVRFASPAAERLIDVEPGEAVGHRLREFTQHSDFARHFPAWRALLADPEGVAHFHLRTRPDLGRSVREPRVLDLTCSNHLDNPAIRGIVVRTRDVTDLSRAEANYRALVENSLQGLAVFCEGRTVFANQAMGQLFGVRSEDLSTHEGAEDLRFIHRDDRDAVREAYHTQSAETVELRFLDGHGEWRRARLQCSPATWEGRPATQVVYADVTAERALAEQRERENERLAQAVEDRTRELRASLQRLREQQRMAVVGTLAAGIAHQINNPVGSILTSADFALLTADEEDGGEVARDALEDIRSQAIRCGKIVRSVLQFARAEPTDKWSGELTTILRTAVDVCSRSARERSATIEQSLSESVGRTTVRMNPIELEQVFVNLIQNAIETRPSGARVRITARTTPQNEVEVVVEDDGPGVSDRDAGQVFDPFYTTRLREGGTGLGLSVAQGIVADHDGRMWLESDRDADSTETPLGGARFHVVLPAEKSPAPARAPQVDAAPEGSSG